MDIQSGLGVGQKWKKVIKIAGVNYVNETGKPIAMSVIFSAQAAGIANVGCTVDGLWIAGFQKKMALNDFETLYFIVPPSAVYQIQNASAIALTLKFNELS